MIKLLAQKCYQASAEMFLKSVLVGILLLITLTSCSNYCDDYLKDQEVIGIITSKYIDEKNRYLNKLVISNENIEYILVIDEKDNELWNFVEEGYHLSKKKGSTAIVIRRNKIEYTFDICAN